MIAFLDSIWLVLALPLAAVLWVYPLPSRAGTVLRCAVILLALLAIAGMSVRLPSRAGTIVVVADRSRSMPQNTDAVHKELIDLLQSGMGPNDRLAVVSFGQGAVIEQAPDSVRFAGFTHVVDPEASNLYDAVDTALALIPRDSPGRIVILSDGRWTGRDPALSASVAAGRGVALDYRHVARPAVGDLAIARVDAPTAVGLGEGFIVTAWVQSPAEQTIKFEVTRGRQVIASGERKVTAGLNRLNFRDVATQAAGKPYQIRVSGPVEDPVPENNVARVLVGVSGPKPILHVTPGPTSGLTALLRAGGLAVVSGQAEEFDFTPAELAGYSAVILENIPADKIGMRGMAMLADWVKASGSGLMMTGGRDSFGQGGYYQSPLEPVLPVSLELRQEHRKFSVAIVVVLDRSGSMSVPAGGGRVKMDLANLGTAKVLEAIGGNDEFGCIAVDTLPHTIASFGRVKDRVATQNKILGIQSMGGGIFIDVALTAGTEMILPATAGARHIILFADADDSEQPGNYKEILAMARKAGITVSAIGLGTPKDKDAALLEDIARRGGGRFMITNSPEELPRLFAHDTFLVARSTFVDTPVQMRATAGLTAIAGRPFALEKSIGGYNLCYIRPEATMAAHTLDEYKAPAVASWQSGAGRVLCYTGEADGKSSGAFARSPEVGEFFTSLARWTAGETGQLGEGMALTQEVRHGINRIQLHLDPDRKTDSFSGNPRITTLRARPDENARIETMEMAWVGPDTLEAAIPLQGAETALSTVMIPGQKPQQLAPTCLPYSPEFAPETAESDRGRAALERLARMTGGVERIELGGVWKDLPRRPRTYPLAPWLLLAAVVLLLLEVLERRTGLFSRIIQRSRHLARLPRRARPRPDDSAVPAATTGEKVAASTPARPASEPVPEAAPIGPSESKEGVLAAMQKARERSRGKTEQS